MSEAISVGSVSVDIVPDTRRFSDEMRAKTRDLSVTVGTRLDDTALRAQLDEVTRNRTATVNVNADTAAAAAKIDELARNRTANVSVRSSGVDSASRGMSGLMMAALGLGPALIPVAAGVAGIGAAFAAPIAASVGGLTIGSFIAGKAVKQTEKQAQAVDNLRKKVAAARIVADRATTPAAKKSALANLAADTAAYQKALHQLNPEQGKFISAQNHMKRAFNRLLAGPGGKAVFAPMVTGMHDLSKITPELAPLLTGVSKGVDKLLGDVDKFVSSAGFDTFMKSFGKESGKAIVSFGRDFENFGKGLFGIFQAFAPLSSMFMAGLSTMSQEFAHFGENADHNKGFQAFVGYVQKYAPKVAQTIGDIAGALGHLIPRLAPLGGVILGAVDGIAKFIRAAPPGTLDAIAVAIGGIAAACGKGKLGLAVAIGNVLTHSKGFNSFLQTAAKFAGQLASAFSKLPQGVQDAAVAAVGTGIIANRLKGGLVGSLLGRGANALTGRGGGVLGALGKMKPVPVYVVNKGFPGGSDVPGPGKPTEGAPEKVSSKFGKFAALAGPWALPLGFTALMVHEGQNKMPKYAPPGTDPAVARGGRYADAFYANRPHKLADYAMGATGINSVSDAIGKLDQQFATLARHKPELTFKAVRHVADVTDMTMHALYGQLPKTADALANTSDKAAAAKGSVDGLTGSIKGVPLHASTLFDTPNLGAALNNVGQLKGMLDGLPRHKAVAVTVDWAQRGIPGVRSLVHSPQAAAPGVRHALPVGATGGIVRRPTLAMIGEAGPEAVVPLNKTPGNGPLPLGRSGHVALTITNWQTGQGYIRETATNQYVANSHYDHVTGGR